MALIALAACAHTGPARQKAAPINADVALEIAIQTFAEAFGRRPPVSEVIWVRQDQCGKGHPSIEQDGECYRGLARGCDLVIAYRPRISDTALAHEVAHCAGWSHDKPDARYDALILQANARMRMAGL